MSGKHGEKKVTSILCQNCGAVVADIMELNGRVWYRVGGLYFLSVRAICSGCLTLLDMTEPEYMDDGDDGPVMHTLN